MTRKRIQRYSEPPKPRKTISSTLKTRRFLSPEQERIEREHRIRYQAKNNQPSPESKNRDEENPVPEFVSKHEPGKTEEKNKSNDSSTSLNYVDNTDIQLKKQESEDGIVGVEELVESQDTKEDSSFKATEKQVSETSGYTGKSKTTVKENEALEEQIFQSIAEGMNAANTQGTANSGVHYASDYINKANKGLRAFQGLPGGVEAGKPYYLRLANDSILKNSLWRGYSDADEQYFWRSTNLILHWFLAPKKSASAALQAWLKGLTITDCNTTIQALHYDAIRKAIGDEKFDEQFGSEKKEIPDEQRLIISARVRPDALLAYTKKTEAAKIGDEGEPGNRPNLQPGQWYYFANHPKYLLKHPGGYWTGEHALYLGEIDGKQRWSGLGLHQKTEEEFYAQMLEAYNAQRTGREEQIINNVIYQAAFKSFGGDLQKARETVESIFDGNKETEFNGELLGDTFPEKIEVKDIFNAPAYENPINKITGSYRLMPKGGFVLDEGRQIDIDKLRIVGDL